MAILNPITSDAKLRKYGVIDLEWVPGETLPLPGSTTVEFSDLTDIISIPLPVDQRITRPLKLRLASFFDQVSEPGPGDEMVKTDRFESFTTIRDLIEFALTSEHRGRWFYAHAGGMADMEFVLDELLQELKEELIAGHKKITVRMADEATKKKFKISKTEDHDSPTWKIRASFSGSSAIIIHVSRGKHAWHFVDSYWLLRDKLSNIGKAIGVGKGDGPMAVAYLKKTFGKASLEDLTQAEIKRFYADAPMDVLVEYNRDDCKILYYGISQFEDEIMALGGQLQQTIASTGMTLFRRSYLKRSIYTSERCNSIAEDSYFSSRVEVFDRNCLDEFKIFDINSSFPYSMTFPLPAGITSVSTRLPEEDSDECLYLADVVVEVPDMPIPPMPYRVDGRVFFPTGRWRSWFTSTDIRLALREGCKIHKVHEVYTFETFYDLKGYVDDIYGKRRDATTEFRKLVLKYLLNCPYGKFAEGMLKQEMLINPDEINREEMQLLQPGVWLKEKIATVGHRHVPVSTFITALSRRHLYDGFKECVRQKKMPLYGDTDSCATSADLPCDDKRLGAFKLEKKMQWAQFLAPKIYRGEGFELKKSGQWEPIQVTKAKGFSLGKNKKEAWEKFAAIAGGDRVGIQRMIRMRELYRTGVTSPVEILVIKALTFEMLTKRFHYPDGKTRPWHIKELVSGDFYPKGFDFEPEIADTMDTATRAMLEAVV